MNNTLSQENKIILPLPIEPKLPTHNPLAIKPQQDRVQIIPLGGIEEIGINCTAIVCRDQIIVIDAGLGFSDADHLGVDYLIPNYDFLVKNKRKIDGIFITHGHLDHIGAIAHFLPALDFPEVFATRFAMELIKSKLQEAKILNKAKLNVINETAILKSGVFQVEYFRVTHSIPESMGLVVRTPVGNIVHSGDFKFDNSPLNEPHSNYYKMSKIGKEGVRLILADSTNSFKPGHSISELEIMRKLEDVVRVANGRVIVATFASLVTRLYALIEIAKKLNRKVYITGRSMQVSIDISRKLKYINATDDLFVDSKSVNRYSDNKILVLATGSQGETMAALARMARGEHRDVQIKKGDSIILSSSIIPGNDALVQTLIDELSRQGAQIFHQDIMNLHTSGHGFIEDQKLMLNLFNPQLFMPVHGYQYFLRRHAVTAQETGIEERNIIIARRGDIIEITKTTWKIVGKVKDEPILISGSGVGDVGPLILKDRERLAKNGVVVITLAVAETDTGYRILNGPKAISRGFVFVKDNRDLISRIEIEVKQLVEKSVKSNINNKLGMDIEKNLERIILNLTEREPLIITNIEYPARIATTSSIDKEVQSTINTNS